MVTVPTYQQNVSLRPAFQQGVTVRSSADDMGAAVGRGLQQAAVGLSNVGEAVAQVQQLEDVTRAKEADNQYAGWLRERMYGENGFMTLQGRNAVDQRSSFEQEAADQRRAFGAGLTPGAARAYESAATARLQSTLQQSIVHTANQRKAWFNEASQARVDTFANDALANFNKPGMVQKNIAAGLLEIREVGRMNGWDADTLSTREQAFTSSVHRNIATRLAVTDPLAAQSYANENVGSMTAADKAALDAALDGPVLSERANRNVANITQGLAPQSYEEPAGARPGPTRERAQRMGLEPGSGAAVSGNMRTPVEIAQQFVGATERADGTAISDFIKRSAGISIDPRVTPWCAAFVNGVLEASGVEGTGKLNARSFLNFGMPTDSPKVGDIVVLSRGDPNGWQGHVGFFQGFDSRGNIRVLGGNQSNGVNVQTYSADKLLGYRTAGAVTEQTTRLPNYGPQGLAQMQQQIMAISDPRERAATQKALGEYYTLQKKAMDAQREQNQAQVEAMIVANPQMDPMRLPIEVQQSIGTSGMTTLMNYREKVLTSGQPTTDDRTLYDLQTQYAQDPEGFAQVDLFQYRDKLSNSDWEKVRGWRQTALTDKRKAKDEGLTLTTAFSQAETQLAAVGITTVGLSGEKREAAAKRTAQFNAALSSEMEAFKRVNDGRTPTQVDIQSMINKLLLPIVVKEPGMLWGTNDRDGFLFEAGSRSDTSTVDVAVEYADIPIDLRRGIALDLERELGRKPSNEEIVQRYEDFILAR